MNRPPLPTNMIRKAWRWGMAAMLVAAMTSASVRAQAVTADVNADSGEVVQAGCTTCAAEKLFPYQSPTMPLGCAGCMGGGGCGGCGDCGGPGCVPGRTDCCAPCDKCGAFGRLFCGLHAALCCPDPCYEPCFIPAANAGFFLDSAKPVTQSRYRFDAIVGGPTPTQGGYFWASAGGPGNIPFTAYDLVLENEFAVNGFSFFVSTPFRITDGTGGAGYADMRIGTKSLLIDSELLLLSFQFTTYLPTGIQTTGGGNGNVGLEPSVLATLKITNGTYFQSQIAEWIGILTQQSVFHYHFSVNHMFAAPRPDMQLIATLEYGSYVFPAAPTFYNIGPGLRFQFCRKVDVGFGMQFAVSNNHFVDQWYRTELRWRF